jgi:hypothetical protein
MSSPTEVLMIEYQIDITDAYLLDLLERQRKLSRLRRLAMLMFMCAAAALLLVCVSSIMVGKWATAILLLPPIVLLAALPRISYWSARRRILQSPMRGQRVNLFIEADGVRSESPTHKAKRLWAGYTQAIMHSDGIELHQGPGMFQWLPDASIKAGTRSEAEGVIASNVSSSAKGEQALPTASG